MTATTESLSGILILDKPQDFTSHDAVAKLRGILHTRRIGHGGTLDPLATGVLPIFIGSATRAAAYATAQDKEYLAGFTLGLCTDTQDVTGTVLERSGKTADRQAVLAALHGFLGRQQQVPPMYSAVKVGGQRLYDLARRGREIDRPARTITVRTLELTAFDASQQCGTFRAVVSKGTYIRTLVHDMGLRLGTFAALHSLRRIRSGEFTLAEALTFPEIERAAADGTAGALLRPTDSLFTAFPRADLTAYGKKRADSGAFIAPEHAPGMPLTPGAICRVYYQNQFCMLGRTETLRRGGPALFVHKNFR